LLAASTTRPETSKFLGWAFWAVAWPVAMAKSQIAKPTHFILRLTRSKASFIFCWLFSFKNLIKLAQPNRWERADFHN
jgi:hypothetical protein